MSDADGYRQEQDSLGTVAVPAARLWGAQTQRSLEHFAIGEDRMPLAVCRALALIKKAAARVNACLGRLPADKAALIERAADEVLAGRLDAEFPLYVWQTGSGTQTNMNVNEVLANRANQLAGRPLGAKSPVHPNDDVNMSQSSNDDFPTAMHLAALEALDEHVLPAAEALAGAAAAHAAAWSDIVKIGRTHLQDAVPLTLGQEWSGYAAQLEAAIAALRACRPALCHLAAGGTAVGTGLNAPPGFGAAIAAELAALTGRPLVTAPNKFAALAGADALVAAMAALRGLAVALHKIANDIRWLGSGPRCGLGEINLPETQPGSSIMPGKVNPVIAESVTMVCAQVIGNDVTVTVGGQAANFELIVMLPVMAYNVLQSIELLSTASTNFAVKCIDGIKANEERCKSLIEESLAMCTALAPEIGYEAAAKLAKEAYKSGKTVRQMAKEQKVLPEKRLTELLDPWRMTEPGGPVGSAGG
ncbi:MAG: class II fumarate hydratase [Terriglobales bacterium]